MKRHFAAGAFALIAAALASPALAMDLRDAPIPRNVSSLPTGFYIGLNAGGGFAGSGDTRYSRERDVFSNTLVSTWSTYQPGMSGVLGGLQFGYNQKIPVAFFPRAFPLSAFIGFETDFQGSGIDATSLVGGSPLLPFVASPSVSTHQYLDYFGTVDGRIGAAILQNFYLYGKGGFAYGGGGSNSTFTRPFLGGGEAFTQWGSSGGYTGWNAGGGVEWQFAPNWSAKVEYLYFDLGEIPCGAAPVFFVAQGAAGWTGNVASVRRTSNEFNVVRAGVNWHFNTPFH